jgi:modulator of FtsH protease HflK
MAGETHKTTAAGSDALGDALRTSFALLRVLMAVLALIYLFSGAFIVHQHEKAVVLTLGGVSGIGSERVKDPGFHLTWPPPFSEILRLPAERVTTLASTTFWHRAITDRPETQARSTAATLRPEGPGYVLTGDANIIHARWAIRYTIDDPEAWLFHVAEVDPLLRLELDRAVTRAAAQFAVDRALRTDIEGLRTAVQDEVTRRGRDLGLGVKIQGVDLLAVAPPDQVAEAFDAVIKADNARDEAISQARAYAARALSEAKGDEQRLRYEGETYRRRVVSEVGADADAFEKVRAAYVKNPDVIRQALLQEAIRRTLSKLEAKYVVPSGQDGLQELRIQLGPEAQKTLGGSKEPGK